MPYQQVDPYTSTREAFTRNIVECPIPPNANETWKSYIESSQNLLNKLASHSAMAENNLQTHMTPAYSKNKVYFMWDFVGRTLGYALQMPPESTFETSSGPTREIWEDVISRTVMTKMLITDDSQDMLERMVESTYPDQRGIHPSLGEEVVAAANALP